MKKVSYIFLLCLVFIFFGSSILFSQHYGDVNEDGSIDIKDALSIALYYVRIITSLPNEMNADVDCNGSINILDALLIAQFYVRLIDQFPCDIEPTPVSSPEPVMVVELGVPFKLKYGQTAQFDEHNFLTFRDVLSDSRCPVDVICVWEGEVEVKLGYSYLSQTLIPVTLSSVNNTEEQVGDYIFVMDTEVLPPRGLSSTTIDKNDYIITITITKAEPDPPLVFISHSGIQCETYTFSTLEEARESLEGNGIKVYSIRMESMFVAAVCGGPSSLSYYAQIAAADHEKALELGWR